MAIQWTIDRFEGRDKERAVLVTEDGETLSMPRSLLPDDCEAGTVVSITIEADAVATASLRDEARSLQKELGRTDPGGDVRL